MAVYTQLGSEVTVVAVDEARTRAAVQRKIDGVIMEVPFASLKAEGGVAEVEEQIARTSIKLS